MENNQNTIVTIDPGASGGIALFYNGRIQAGKMPKSIPELNDYFRYIKDNHSNITIFIEAVSAWTKGDDAPGKKHSINKMLKNYAELLTVIKLCGLKYVEVYPISWQTTLGLKIKRPKGINDGKFKTMRKKAYKEYAQNCFPELKVTLATSDALCLVQFALIKISSDIEWIRKNLKNGTSNQMKIE